MGYRDYSTARGHIVAADGSGDFTTVSAAISAASSGQTIFVRPGTYTENITLKAGVNICAFSCDSPNPNVNFVGKCSFSAAGNVSISGIQFTTNSDYAISVTGSSASVLYLFYCYINCSNNTGIQLSSSSSSSAVVLQVCDGNIATTGIGFFNHSGLGTLAINYSSALKNSGGSSTASTVSGGGALNVQSSNFLFPVQLSSSSSFVLYAGSVNSSGTNTTSVSLTGTSTFTGYFCAFSSGSASSVEVGSGCLLDFQGVATIGSSNTNALNGAGTCKYALIIFSGSSFLNNVTTQLKYTSQPAI